MASIKVRGNSVSVLHRVNGDLIWETIKEGTTLEKKKEIANEMVLDVEYQTAKGQKPKAGRRTMEDLFQAVFEIHITKRRWEPGTFTANQGLLINHILPHIGSKPLRNFDSRERDLYYDLLSRKVRNSYVDGKAVIPHPILKVPTGECLAPTTIKKIHNLLNIAFNYALKWNWISSVPQADLPEKREKKERTIWSEKLMAKALVQMADDPFIHLAVHLSYIGSLRNGEVCGITIDRLHLQEDRAKIEIDKTLQRASKQALEKIPGDSILKVFPNKIFRKTVKSVLILKTTKTEESHRMIFLTAPLKKEIEERLKVIEKQKADLGDEYHDYGLLICLPNGDPMEPKLLLDWFHTWQEAHPGFPDLVFHGIRHSSTTYKLRVSGGDIKSVQGDNGHASSEMVLDVYSHVQESARIELSEKIEDQFYAIDSQKPGLSSNSMLNQLAGLIKSNPEMQQQLLFALLS